MKHTTTRLFLSSGLVLLLTSGRFFIRAAEVGHTAPETAEVAVCDVEEFTRSEAIFRQMVEIRTGRPNLFSEEEQRAAALNYISNAEQCYDAAIQPNSQAHVQAYSGPITIDEGGLSPYPDQGLGPLFNTTYGLKWGAGSPYNPNGQDVAGPGTSGGTVTYSYIPAGVSHSYEGLGSNTDVRTGLGVNSCVQAEIATAFAAWSAMTDIQFVEVADSAAASGAAGATGDIRIGAHSFDGPFNILGHAYFPPVSGDTFFSIAGDLHFDAGETWSCTTVGGIDIGLVALHEIGHSIGLGHEPSPPAGDQAVMNPVLNPALTGLLQDDIDGAISVYGPAIPTLTLNKTLDPTSVVTSSATITYVLKIQNNSSQLVTNTTVSDIIPPSTTYLPNSAEANPYIGNLTNFPTTTPPFTVSANSRVVITYALQVGLVNKGDLVENTATLSAPILPQSLQANYIVIVDAVKMFLPIITRNN